MIRSHRPLSFFAVLALVAAVGAAVIFAAAADPPAKGPRKQSSQAQTSQTPPAPPSQVKNPYAPDTVEPGSVEAIARFTTEPRFGNPWVAYLPDSATVPSPTEYLGHVVGAAGELSSTAKIYGYFRKLAATSPRVRLQTIGRSEEGRDILLAAIADEDGIRYLDKLKAATATLADPRKTSPEAAEAITSPRVGDRPGSSACWIPLVRFRLRPTYVSSTPSPHC